MNMIGAEWDLEIAIDAEGEGKFEKGLKQGREESVKNLREYGMAAEEIAKVLKLPLETVEQPERPAIRLMISRMGFCSQPPSTADGCSGLRTARTPD